MSENISVRLTIPKTSFEESGQKQGLIDTIAQVLGVRTEDISIVDDKERLERLEGAVYIRGSFC